jgi:hypothetical protein
MMKKKTSEATVTESSAQAVLRRGGARALAPDEEKVMRMRLGASLPRKGEIEWMGAADAELSIELRAMEIETYLRLRAHQTRRVVAAATPTPSRTKDKIVRALRRKGPTR